MGEIADDLFDRMLNQPDDYWGDEDDGGITCTRCGQSELYWQKVFSADGERRVLFNSDGKRHVCKITLDGMSPE